MLHQWRRLRSPSLLVPQLHGLRLHARMLGSAPSGSVGKEQDTVPPTNSSQSFHQVPAAVKAFYATTHHFIIPYTLVIPRVNEIVVDGRVVPAGVSVIAKTKVSQNAIVYGRVKDVSEIAWPDEVRGLRLGRRLSALLTNPMNRIKYARVIQELREMGFPVDEDWPTYWWREQILASLKTFAAIEGHSRVPIKFEIPRDDLRWPSVAWGLRLGRRVDTLRVHYDRQRLPQWQVDDLDAISFTWVDDKRYEWDERILPSLHTFAAEHGHCDVPASFVVPRTPMWPEAAWGMNLGIAVSNIRARGDYKKHWTRDFDQLEAIGFVWSSKQDAWDGIYLPAFQVYFQQFGHCWMRSGFVVPSESPWPVRAWGKNLGNLFYDIFNRDFYEPQRRKDREALAAIRFGVKPEKRRRE